VRSFVALDISVHEVLDSIVAFQAELTRTGADVKTVERENIHFTVKFLGEVTQSQAREADARLKALSLASIDVEVRGVGAFPSLSHPNVIWAGVPKEQEGLVDDLANKAIAALEGIGERDRRPFTAHATLARVRSTRGSSALTAFLRDNLERSFGRVRLAELKLKSSVLNRQGPTYNDIGVYPLS